MSACLSCGDCCKRMCPLPVDGECPHLREPKPGIFVCANYEDRPERCANHDFDARFCPIGASVLGLTDPQEIARRIDEVWRLVSP